MLIRQNDIYDIKFLDNPLAILLSKTGHDLHFSPTSDQILSLPANIQPNDDNFNQKPNDVSKKHSCNNELLNKIRSIL